MLKLYWMRSLYVFCSFLFHFAFVSTAASSVSKSPVTCKLCSKEIKKRLTQGDIAQQRVLTIRLLCCASENRYHSHCLLGYLLADGPLSYPCCKKRVAAYELDRCKSLLVPDIVLEMSSLYPLARDEYAQRAFVLENTHKESIDCYLKRYPHYSSTELETFIAVLKALGCFPLLLRAAEAALADMLPQQNLALYNAIMKHSQNRRRRVFIEDLSIFKHEFFESLNTARAMALCTALLLDLEAAASDAWQTHSYMQTAPFMRKAGLVRILVLMCTEKFGILGLLEIATEVLCTGGRTTVELIFDLAHSYRYTENASINRSKFYRFLRLYLDGPRNTLNVFVLLYNLNIFSPATPQSVRNKACEIYRQSKAAQSDPIRGADLVALLSQPPSEKEDEAGMLESCLEEAAQGADTAEEVRGGQHIIRIYAILFRSNYHPLLVNKFIGLTASTKSLHSHPVYALLYTMLPSTPLLEKVDADRLQAALCGRDSSGVIFLIRCISERDYFTVAHLYRLCEGICCFYSSEFIRSLIMDFFGRNALFAGKFDLKAFSRLQILLGKWEAEEELLQINKRILKGRYEMA